MEDINNQIQWYMNDINVHKSCYFFMLILKIIWKIIKLILKFITRDNKIKLEKDFANI